VLGHGVIGFLLHGEKKKLVNSYPRRRLRCRDNQDMLASMSLTNSPLLTRLLATSVDLNLVCDGAAKASNLTGRSALLDNAKFMMYKVETFKPRVIKLQNVKFNSLKDVSLFSTHRVLGCSADILNIGAESPVMIPSAFIQKDGFL
jgi:hypothetical protein